VTDASSDALVVGSGPNGLAAAVALAEKGVSVTVLEGANEIGGGTRTRNDLTVPGLVHDVCSAIHPFGVMSPCFDSWPLNDYGLEWRWPDVDLAHPLDGGRTGVMVRSIDRTAAALGADGSTWRQVFGPVAGHFEELAPEILGPVIHLPRHPVRLTRLGVHAALPASILGKRFRTDEARALWAGCAAHIFRPLNRPATSAMGVAIVAAGHFRGWPVASGGSQAITRALARLLVKVGGTIETGTPVTSMSQVSSARVVLFDTSPPALAAIAGDRLPPRTRRAFERWRFGPAAFKIDLAIEEGIPWAAEPCRLAGTVHVGGTLEEIASSEADVHRGRMPDRPFVLVGQQYICDPQRSVGDVHPIWTYAHVPHGYDGDATDVILNHIERFAPGFRERIVGRHVIDPPQFERDNPNYVGGDILSGANDVMQLVFRPRPGLHPYATGIPGVFLCSSATPPGAGVHGMCGYHAAQQAVRYLSRA
jgi:phytoene dehydrogenase-like protein